MKLNSKALKAHINKRLDEQNLTLPTRFQMLFEDLDPVLTESKRIDVFDLLVELVLCADRDPALYLSTLLAVMDDDALIDLDQRAIANTGAFIRDSLKQDCVRLYLRMHQGTREKKKGKG